MTSPDGITWTSQTTPATDDWWFSVKWGGSAGQERFVAVASSFNTGNRFMTSPDGITWTAEASGIENAWFSVTWGGATGQEKFVAVSVTGTGNRVMTSSFVATAPGAPTINTVTAGDGSLTVAFTAGTASSNPTTNYKYSTDGITYTALSPASTTSPFTITGLTNGTAYSVTIKAVNSVGDSAASNAVSGTPVASSSGSSSTSSSSTSTTSSTTPTSSSTSTTSTTIATATTNAAPTASAIKLFLPKTITSITGETLGTGDDVDLAASGFQPSETVIVGFAEDPTGVSTVTASAAGRASATVAIPTTKNGKVTAYLYGTNSKRGVKQTLTVTDLPATGTDSSLPTLLGALLVVSGVLIVARRRLVQ
jgi:LPXTG-motif cell wall-anchored protein